MGHNLIQQRRGKGTIRFRSPSFRFVGRVKYRKYDEQEKNGVINGKIIDLVNCPGHSAPLMKVKYDNGEEVLMIAPENVIVNQPLFTGASAENKVGNVLPLKNISKDSNIYCLEIKPGDGGKLVRTPGGYARIVSSSIDSVSVRLPSGKIKEFSPQCRATIGIIAGSGKQDKPFVKAGNRFYAKKAKGKMYPRVSPVKMNPIDHPFGCGRAKNMGRSAIPRRGAPPGARVGLISARRTGRKR
ncbi:MAG: 50S ribosomal protein L2 [Candidatus Nanoarchaeia archaeon]|nr:50S ribosomal protein L2 [Candidatus Nanoarchaeia archaeon]